jgi:aprataxin
MSTTTVLRDYALIADPASIPLSIRLSHTPKSVAIFDAYPKSIFHILVLPLIISPLTVSDLESLRNLLGNKKRAIAVLLELAEHAKNVKAIIEEEMMSRYGFRWDIWIGFHAVPSLTSVFLSSPLSLMLTRTTCIHQTCPLAHHFQ